MSFHGQPGETRRTRPTRITHLGEWKAEGRRWPMLTAYDFLSAQVFEEAGIPVLLVGDSAANVVYGLPTTVPVTVDELLPLVRGVVRGAPTALVVADLPFGSYEWAGGRAFESSVRFLKEGGAHAVKLEGGRERAGLVSDLVAAGIPVMAHIGFTPQSVNALGGYRVQGRSEEAAEALRQDARALAEAGAFAVVLEMVPADLAAEVTADVGIPTIGIGAGSGCDAQVLVWQDMAGLTTGTSPRFVRRFADVHGTLLGAARDFAQAVQEGTFPADEHSF